MLTVRRRVRPIRLGFLVRSNDRAAILRIIETNTCLWGGRYNAIIPYARSGLRDGVRRWSCNEVVAGYLAHFEPDFLVDMVGEAKNFVKPERVLDEADVFDRSKSGHVGHGISINAVYGHHYNAKFRFVRRHPDTFVMPASSSSDVELAVAAAFGRFPKDLPHFAKNFREVFEPDEKEVSAETLFTKLRAGTPLKVTSDGLKPRRRGLDGPAIFLLDAHRPQDVVDYWNLRAVGWQLLPFPIHWEDTLEASARAFLSRQMQWYASNSYLRPPTMLLAARSVTAAEFSRVSARLSKDAPAPILSQPWYPPLWNRWSDSDDVERCTLEAVSDEAERPVQGEGERQFVTLPALSPAVYDGQVSLFDNGPKWATVVSISSGSRIPTAAPVIPVDADDVASILMLPPREAEIQNEGLTLYTGTRFRQYLCIPQPEAVARAAFRAKGFTATTSAAGRIAMAMIRALGGPIGVGSIAFPELIRKLDDMSHGLVEFASVGNAGRGNGKPQARARFDTRASIFGLLKRLQNNNNEVAERQLQRLLDAGVFRVGLQLACPECTQANWFSLDDVQEKLRCERCMANFSFPAALPPRTDAWTYRTQGPFSVENYGQGSYAVVLVLRLLTLALQHTDQTWIPSTTLKSASDEMLEADFVMWRRDSFTPAVELLFGECKSFGLFGSKDFENAAKLATSFPGAFHVFATLRDELTRGEQRRLAALAKAGRTPIEAGRWRAPLIILTGREIFSDFGPPFCWKNLPAPFARAAQLCKPATDLLSFAQATQFAYLGIEPDESRIRALNLDAVPNAPRPRSKRRRTKS